jgi:hypothetical protein
MLDKMQYILEQPTKEKFMTWKCQIKDNEGKLLGSVTRQVPSFQYSTKTPQVWFEDANGIRLGEMRSDKQNRLLGFAVYDHVNELRGIVDCPMEVRGLTRSSRGSFLLMDSARMRLAMSDVLSYPAASARFDSLRNGTSIKSPDGNLIALLHEAKTSAGCQIDIYSNNLSHLLILGLIASMLFL